MAVGTPGAVDCPGDVVAGAMDGSGASPGWVEPGGVLLPTGGSGSAACPLWLSRSCRVGGGLIGPGQTSPGSGVNGSTVAVSPIARRMFSLSPGGRFGLEPVVNGRACHVPNPP